MKAVPSPQVFYNQIWSLLKKQKFKKKRKKKCIAFPIKLCLGFCYLIFFQWIFWKQCTCYQDISMYRVSHVFFVCLQPSLTGALKSSNDCPGSVHLNLFFFILSVSAAGQNYSYAIYCICIQIVL